MGKIESAGVYLFEVLESGLGTTKEKGFPQWVARLKATHKWVETAEEITHFQGQGLLTDGQPGYVDWSAFNEETLGYMVLFNSADSFDENSKMLNYEQLQAALGWDGSEFDTLADGSHVGKVILGRMEDDNYNGKQSVKLNWIDSKDAPASRQLKTLAIEDVKGLAAKLKIGKKPVKPVVAAPTRPVASPAISRPAPTAPSAATAAATRPATPTAPTAPAATAPSKPGKPSAATSPAPSASSAAKPATTPTPAPKSPSKPPVSTPPAAQPVAAEEATGLPGECSQMDAWTVVSTNKGGNGDDVIQEAWISACGEVLGTRDEAEATPGDWAKIRDIVVRDCGLTVAA